MTINKAIQNDGYIVVTKKQAFNIFNLAWDDCDKILQTIENIINYENRMFRIANKLYFIKYGIIEYIKNYFNH